MQYFFLKMTDLVNHCWFINRAYLIMYMGGAKKPTAASKDKSSSAKVSKKGKKDAGQESGPKKAEIVVKVNGEQALKIVKNSKVITAQDLARHLGVKISATNKFLKNALSEGTVSVIGGYSGHYLYQDAELAKAEKEKRESDLKSKRKKTTSVEQKSDSKGNDAVKTDNTTQDNTPNTTTDTTQDNTPNTTTDTTQDTTQDNTPNTTTDTTQDNTPNTTTDTTQDNTPNTTTDTTQDTITTSTPSVNDSESQTSPESSTQNSDNSSI